MALLDKLQYKLLLKQLDIPFEDFPLPQQRLLHQLLEKHLLVFAIANGPEDYRFTKATDYPIHTGHAPFIWEWCCHIPPTLCKEVQDLLHNILQSGVIPEST